MGARKNVCLLSDLAVLAILAAFAKLLLCCAIEPKVDKPEITIECLVVNLSGESAQARYCDAGPD